MHGSPASVVEEAFRCYRWQDVDAALPLYADDFTFTSPQDDHIDRAAFFRRCFPTADRFREQRLLHVTPAGDEDGAHGEDGELVFVHYEYELTAGGRYRNVEAVTVRDGLIREVQVFFGGRVQVDPSGVHAALSGLPS